MATTPSVIYFNELPALNDLEGTFEGGVWLAQSTIIPSPAHALPEDVQPRLVARRKALVLFKPISQVVDEQISLQVFDGNGAEQHVTVLARPESLPRIIDGGVSSGGIEIEYGEGFWSATLPEQCVQSGMTLVFHSGDQLGRLGTVAVGAPSELLLNTIDIGMLAPPRDVFTSQFSAEHQRQYFMLTPCSRLIVNPYEPVDWSEIMMPDGILYTDYSTSPADLHTGDLREKIGKELISLGINRANCGLHSSPAKVDDGLNNISAQVTAHSSLGRYAQGVVIHGASGGGGMATLQSNTGNDFGRGVGQACGVFAIMGGFAGEVHRPSGSINSTWGWDGDNNLFVPNFWKIEGGSDTCSGDECQAPFHGHAFCKDPTAYGYTGFPNVMRYPLYTPYGLDMMQRHLENRVVFSSDSSTGYRKWDYESGFMAEWAEFRYAELDELTLEAMTELLGMFRLVDVSIYDNHHAWDVYLPPATAENRGHGLHFVHNASYKTYLHVNGNIVIVKDDVLNYESDGTQWIQVSDFSFQVLRKPEQMGVPVTTLVGYYDPDGQLTDYLYPALHCAYANVHKADRRIEASTSTCYIEVSNAKGETLQYVLRTHREDATLMNAFHINVEQAFAADSITLYRNRKIVAVRQLLPPAGTTRVAIIGRQ